MSKKTLNKANLQTLGVDRLAELLIEVSTGSAEIKRRLRLELSHNLGPAELARDVRKRLASIRRSKSYVGWRKRKALIKDLSTQAEMIIEKIAPDDPNEAFELLWLFTEMAPSVYGRVDDSRGDVAAVFGDAFAAFSDIAPNALLSPRALAQRIWDALCDNKYGEFDGLITALAPTLGDDGLSALKTLVIAHQDTPSEPQEDHAALQFLRDLRSTSGSFAADQKRQLTATSLQEIATAQGDIDSYIAQFSEHDLSRPKTAAKVAQMLLQTGRPEEALERILDADPTDHPNQRTVWDEAYIACLIALERIEDAQSHRWTCFCDTLHPQYLRDYLKVLPDFEDIEAEDAAKAHVRQSDALIPALAFLFDWPDHALAAEMVLEHGAGIDGRYYDVLAAGAEKLRDRYPLAAILLWRAMIEQVLFDGQVARYGQATDHLMDCIAADASIEDYGQIPRHTTFVETLQARYPRKASFWAKVSG